MIGFESAFRLQWRLLSRLRFSCLHLTPADKAVPMARFSVACAACLLLSLAPLAWAEEAAKTSAEQAAGLEFFEQKIRPVLVAHCYECHSAKGDKVQGGLVLDSRDAMRQGGDSGPAVSPGAVDDSLLVSALKYDGFEMPPKGRLPDETIADFEKWIEMGAPDPRSAQVEIPASTIDFEEAANYWAFQPPRQRELPAIQNTAWPRNEIDHFILAQIEQQGLHPVRFATKRELIRRASFDLLGLPPTPAEVAAFLADESPDAYRKLIDRLLESPHYGERWGRYWLDVARYAEDQAHTFAVKPNTEAWRYRQWVIDALNADLPYDEFVRMQIAGDQLDDAHGFDRFAALGFFGLGAVYYKNSDKAKALADELDDRIDTLTRGFLGLTVSCARCHDHKFDPIPTADYYSLAGIFGSSRLANLPLVPRETVAAYDRGQQEVKQAERRLRETYAESQAGRISEYVLAIWRQRVSAAHKKPLSLRDLAKETNLPEDALKFWTRFLESQSDKHPAFAAWNALPKPTKETSLEEPAAEVREVAAAIQKQIEEALRQRDGDGDGVEPSATPAKLSKEQTELLKVVFNDGGLFRLSEKDAAKVISKEDSPELQSLAEAVEQAKQAAPAMYPIAHGIQDAGVKDMNVFIRGNPARQGEVAPRQFLRILAGEQRSPYTAGSGRLELADDIASADNPLTARVIVNRVWQQHFGRGLVGTPSNFGRLGETPSHPQLLDWLAVELVQQGWSLKSLHRQIMLSSTYQLSSDDDEQNAEIDGDNRYLWRMNRRRLDVEAWRDSLLAVAGNLDDEVGGENAPLTGNRRTVYAKVSRHELDELLRLFDFPDANVTSEKRTVTTVPQQQLFVLNSDFVVQQAKALAKRLSAAGQTDEDRIRSAFALLYARSPQPRELEIGLQFLSAAGEDTNEKISPWEQYAQALLSLNELMYID